MFTQNQYDLPGSAVIQLQSPVIPGKIASFSDQGEHIPPSGIRHIRLIKGKDGIRGGPGLPRRWSPASTSWLTIVDLPLVRRPELRVLGSRWCDSMTGMVAGLQGCWQSSQRS